MLKLAYEAPLTGLHVAEAFAEAELPAGVLNVLTGRGSTVGAALVRDPRVRAISFTGSVATGHWVRDEATKAGKRVQLELGGQNPLIVMDDADLAARRRGRLRRRVLVGRPEVHRDAPDPTCRTASTTRSARSCSRGSSAARVGDPLDPEVEVGPIVNESQFDEIVAAIERGRDEGGTVIAGGERADDDGYLIAPTVFEGVADDAFLSCEEVFGPGHVALPLRDARRGARARERRRVRPLGGDLHLEPRPRRRASSARRRPA